jgi:hypothetical protein
MRGVIRTFLSVAAVVVVVVVVMCTPSPAAAGLNVNFQVQYAQNLRQPASPDAWQIYPFLSEFRTHALRSPHGLSGADGTPGQTAYLQHSYPSFAAMQTEASGSGPWTLTLTGATPAQTSTYAVSPDFNSISLASLATTSAIHPSVNEAISNKTPLISWTTPSAPISYAQPEIDAEPLGNFIFGPTLSATQTSWQVPQQLNVGQYSLFLWLYQETINLPMTSTLLSGPDLGPISATFRYNFQGLTPFTIIVPEPASCATLLLIGAAALSRRRPRRQPLR